MESGIDRGGGVEEEGVIFFCSDEALFLMTAPVELRTVYHPPFRSRTMPVVRDPVLSDSNVTSFPPWNLATGSAVLLVVLLVVK